MLKGQSKIELTDIRTNKKESYIEENLVTNAVPDLLRLNPSGLMYPIQSTEVRFENEIFPIATKCYGGILLFENPLVEDVNNILPPGDNKLTGHASNDVNQTDNQLRGSFNLTESKAIDGGYKLVWDFSTSQGNGTISSLALTHYRGGVGFYGDIFSREALLKLNYTYASNQSPEDLRYYGGMIEINPAENYFISISRGDNNAIIIAKIKEPFTSIGLTDSVFTASSQILESISLDGAEFFSNMRYEYCNFFDGANGYWYGFINSGNSYGNAKVNRMKISKTDYSCEINNWELENVQLSRLGRISKSTDRYQEKYTSSVLRNGYIYIPSDDGNSIYKINIDNPVDVTKIELSFKTYISNQGSGMNLYLLGDYIVGRDLIIDLADNVSEVKNVAFNDINSNLCRIGPFYIGYEGESSSSGKIIQKNLYLHTPYLGTINNLPTPILKTADKTMKITYTLTEDTSQV